MRITHRTIVTFALLALAGCGGPKYSVDYDPNARFDGLKTYRVEKNDQLLLKAREDLLGLNLRSAIEGAIDRSLTARGYARAAEPVDFLVRYRVEIEQTASDGGVGSERREVHDANTSGTNPYVPLVSGQPGAGPIDRQTGRLVVEILDPKTNAGIWRGTSSQGLPDRSTDAAKVKLVEDVVAELLNRFPPK